MAQPWYVVAIREGESVPELVGPFDDEHAASVFADRWRRTSPDAAAAYAVTPQRTLRGT